MRRTVGVLTSAALALSLSCAAVRADSPALTPHHFDLATQLMFAVFGETDDSAASFSAQNGDRFGESPLRELALRPPEPESAPTPQATQYPAFSQVRFAPGGVAVLSTGDFVPPVDAALLPTHLQFAAPPQPADSATGAPDEQGGIYTADYRPVAPLPNISPEPGTFAFDSGSAPAPLPAKDSPLAFRSDLHHQKRTLSLNFSGAYTAEGADALGASLPQAASLWEPQTSTLGSSLPISANNRLSLGAGLAVPVFRGLTLNLNYDAQRSYNSYVLPGLQSTDATNNFYTGGLTYHIPYSSSSLSISAYQNHLGDLVAPINGYTQTGENVNFTVKF